MAAQGRSTILFLSFLCLFFCLLAPAYAQTQHDLVINVIPSDGGTVKADCTTPCQYNVDSWANLLAIPNSGYVFNYWDVDCTGSNPSVAVMMAGPKTCNANFLPCNTDTPFKMGATYYGRFREAYRLAAGGETIDVLATTIQESLRLDRLIPVTLKGGYRCWEEGTPSSYTLLQGQMIFKEGAATVENLMILSGTPPVITSFEAIPSLIFPGESSTLHWTVADATEVFIDDVMVDDPINGSVIVFPSSSTTYNLKATNSYGSDMLQVAVSVLPPGITNFMATPDVISSGQSSTLRWTATGAISVVIDQGIGEVDPATGSVEVNPTTTTTYTITLTNAAGTITKKITVGVIPSDPAAVAPPVDQTVTTTVYDASSFLYTGSNPVQTGVAPETIEPTRASVLRGKVLDDNGVPLAGVTITILNHPEYGQTITRSDGMFDMVVNGGGLMNVKYQKTGYLTVQRQRDIPWQDYMWLPEITMIEADPNVNVVDLTSQSDFQVVRGRVRTDERGTRQSTVLIPKGTQAWMVFPDGHEEPITLLTVRATEFTVGANGESKMPAELPPTSAYTYCEEFTVEEAVAAGAPDVRFSQMAISYNENFLNFPVGTGIPLGSYDRERGVWIPSDNGKVVKIVSINNGLAELDTDGNGTIDNGISLGITDPERAALANLYTAGQSLWRVLAPHFTTWDKNMGTSCEGPCDNPNMPPFGPKEPTCPTGEQANNKQPGSSIILCQSQGLAEDVPITGTPYYLHYQSDRSRGMPDKYQISIPLTGASISPSLRRVYLQIEVAGNKMVRSFAPAANLTDTFTWNGKDAYGRTVQGRQPITVRIGYAFKLIYTATDRFGYNGGGTVMVTDNQFIMWQVQQGWIGTLDAQGQGLGGWMLNLNHFYDSNGKMLYQGDGVSRDATSMPGIITTVAGTGCQAGFGCPYEPYGDGGPAIYAPLNSPRNIALGQDGSLFIATGSRIRRVATDGIITTVAGVCSGGCVYNGYSGEGGPATQAQLGSVYGVKVGPDGSLYIADNSYHRIFRVGPDGIITTVAGTGAGGYSGDGGPALNAKLLWPSDVALGQDGSLYIVDSGNYRIRRVGTDGIITTVAGTGAYGCSGDGGPAVNATLYTFNGSGGLAVGPDGSLYIADTHNHAIRRVGPDGIISTVAGRNCTYPGYSGDGGLATNAILNFPRGVSIGPDGSIYISDSGNSRIRRVGPDGIITTIAGNGSYGYSGDGGSALDASFGTYSNHPPSGVEAGHDGNLYIADLGNSVIRRVASVFPGLQVSDFSIASDDGSQVFFFNSSGKHLKTINSLTGANLNQFGYDANGLLATVTDGDGNVTTAERDSSGNPTAIVGPYGQRTTLILDANGYLASVTNPANESTSLQYTSDGLITKMTTPRGYDYTYTYDALGRLTKDEDPAGGSKSLSRTEITNGYQVAVTTAMGRSTNYSVEHLPIGDQHMVNTYPDGTKVDTLDKKNGSSTIIPDGTTLGSLLGPDPRFGMQAPVLKTQTIAMPSTLTATSAMVRTATLSTPGNPLTLTSLKDEVTINGRKYTTNYTASTKTVIDTSPAGRQVTAKIDLQGRVVEYQMAGLSLIQFSYDAQGRLTSASQGSGPDLRESTYQYNAQGFLQTNTNPLMQTMSFEYDQAGRVTRKVLPDNRYILYAYDSSGNVTALTPPGRPSHAFTYTPVDLMAEYTPPDIGIGTVKTQYSFNTDRQLSQVLRPDGLTIDFGYDSGGRVSAATYPGGPLTYSYDPMKGYVTNISGPGSNSISYAYDGMLMTSENWTGDVTGSVSRAYDNNFRVTGISINGGNIIGYQYDNDSLITKAGDLTLARNAQNGFLTGSTLGNVTDAWTYNSFGEPASYLAKYGATEVFKQQFTYDKLGRIIQKIETVDGVTATYEYAYDPAGRLIEVKKNGSTVSTYAYDSNDNRVSYTGTGGAVSGTYDNQDRLMQYGTATYSYTANGELQSKTTGGQTTLDNYDVFGNLKSVTLADGTLIEYAVDGRNRRLGKKVNGAWVRKFLYCDDLKPIAELDEVNNVISVFIYGSRYTTPDYMIKNGTTYRIISDHLGSPRLIVDAATGAVVQRVDYDEFGNVINDTSPGFQPFGFAGGLYDPDTKLIRFGARDYDVTIGRWTSKDPILFNGQHQNLYSYVSNDPVNNLDPVGTEWIVKNGRWEYVEPPPKVKADDAKNLGEAGAHSAKPKPLEPAPKAPRKPNRPHIRGKWIPCFPYLDLIWLLIMRIKEPRYICDQVGYRFPGCWEKLTPEEQEKIEEGEAYLREQWRLRNEYL